MTIALGCYFRHGAVMAADSRATWKISGRKDDIHQDQLRKVLPLSNKIALCYAGNAAAANVLTRALRKKIGRKPSLKKIGKLAQELPRIAKFFFTRGNYPHGLSLILGGVSETGEIALWKYESPTFAPEKVIDFVVIGSGAPVSSYISNNYGQMNSKATLKECTDSLILGIQSALDKLDEPTVGGMLQVILLDASGIRPFSYGFMDINPDGPGEAKNMKFEKGTWVQDDMRKGMRASVIDPDQLRQPRRLRMHDFTPSEPEAKKHKFHLTYFLTCGAVKRKSGTIEFNNCVTNFGKVTFPLDVELIAAVGLWGATGQHAIEFSLVYNGSRTILYSGAISAECVPEEQDINVRLEFEIAQPGHHILEFLIDGKLVGRRALHFYQLPKGELTLEAAEKELQALHNCHLNCNDVEVEKSKMPNVVYFMPCRNVVSEELYLKFEEQTMAIFSKNYPFVFKCFLAAAFRFPKGENRISIELVNVATRDKHEVAHVNIISKSSCTITPIHGELNLKISKPGLYFLNARAIDGALIACALFAAETDKPEWSYTLPAEHEKRVENGEILILTRHSQQAPAATA